MTQKLIRMTEKELARHDVIKTLIDGKINGTDASKPVGVSVRQVKRLKLKVLEFGAEGLAHGNRGKDSNRKLDEGTLKKVETFIREKYYDFGPKLASEKLEELDALDIVNSEYKKNK